MTENLPKPNQTPSKHQSKPECTKILPASSKPCSRYPKPTKTPTTQPQKHPRAPQASTSCELCRRVRRKAATCKFWNSSKGCWWQRWQSKGPPVWLFLECPKLEAPFGLDSFATSVSYSPHSPHGFENPRSGSALGYPWAFFRVPPARFRGPQGWWGSSTEQLPMRLTLVNVVFRN